MKKEVMNTPIRWAGSKKKVLNEMLTFFDNESENYIEPFLGSGVVLINLLNNIEEFKFKDFFVNDINNSIINFYILLRDNVEYLNKQAKKLVEKYNNLKSLAEQQKFYYNIREKYNKITDNTAKSIYFYFLMKTGYNGVYRENSTGNFNVPFGKKVKINYDLEYMIKLSECIKNVKFYNLDYKEFLKMLEDKGVLTKSFVYFDPPYIPEDKAINKKQELYTKKSFEHEEFINYINKLKINKFLISMSESREADLIYGEYKKYRVSDIIRTINPKKLLMSKEVVYSNYTIKK